MPILNISPEIFKKMNLAFEIGAEGAIDNGVHADSLETAQNVMLEAAADADDAEMVEIDVDDNTFEVIKMCIEVGGEGSDEIDDLEWSDIQEILAGNTASPGI